MITVTSTIKSVSMGTAISRPKWVWQPQCSTEVSLVHPVRDSSRFDTLCAQLKSFWSEIILVWIGWSEPILVLIVWSELAFVAPLMLGFF